MRRSRKLNRGSSSIAQILFTTGLIVLLLIIAGAAGLFVFDRVYDFTFASDILPNFTVEEPSEEPSEVVFDPGEPLPRWEGTERVNILVMGIDQREFEEGPWRTDTMMVLTIDPVTKSGGMLSIPRDLWVPIPGYEEGRINQAHFFGELYDYPGGGPGLAVETVQYNLGVPIHYYGRFNFTAFEELVDIIGGVDVLVPEEINDNTYPDEAYGYDPLHIPAGQQHLNGEMALKYARTRHSPDGDFGRAKRQQQVIMSIFDQVTRLELLPQLASRAPELWQTLQGAVETDLTIDQIIALAQLGSELSTENIRYGVIDEYYTQFWTTPDGQQVLIPLRDRMREMRDYIFTSQAPIPEYADDPAARLAEEAATIKVMNGTMTEGLAGRTSNYLQLEGFHVITPTNADRSDYTETLIIVYTGKIYTAEYLTHFLNLPATAVIHGPDPNAAHDISLILGTDYQPVE
ncbi:MAG: LCP family protein [Chloroflexi bacterium]|nr:LCP family protein [Chloroflexota bacterium]